MGKPCNEIIAATDGVQEEWLRDESEHPYKFVPTKASGNTVPFPAITKCNTFILRHYAAGIVEEIGQVKRANKLKIHLLNMVIINIIISLPLNTLK